MKTMFADRGVHVVVDGQFGSTGKGLMASYLAVESFKQAVHFQVCYSNAGPNSGHTFYHQGGKVVLKQLPSFAVKRYLLHSESAPTVYLTAGAIIDPEILIAEASRYPGLNICVDPRAAVVRPEDKDAEKEGSIAAVAGTRSGTGQAIANKVLRKPDAIVGAQSIRWPSNVRITPLHLDYQSGRSFMEVSQGFSLGIHSHFYPKVTSRECTASQGLADARLPAAALARTFMVVRTFPIRVGDVDGFSSGAHYTDQSEISFEDLGVEPERTTVTNRIRRVFTWSNQQFTEAVFANAPDFVLFNFMNYLTGQDLIDFQTKVAKLTRIWEFQPLFGWGAHDEEVTPF